jgi:hypothetical protein
MAKLPPDHPLNGMTGTLDGLIVFKKYGNTTVVSKMPDMRRAKLKPSPRQKARRQLFKEAVAYARSITRDPDKKAAYAATLPPRKAVFQAAIQEFLGKKPQANPSPKKGKAKKRKNA